jgi:hypothetical protein
LTGARASMGGSERPSRADDSVTASNEPLYARPVATLRHVASGDQLPLAARHVIGRAATCDLRLGSPNVSGIHAEIVWSGESWTLQDLGSRNGTFIDDRRLAAGERTEVHEGATLAFGLPEHSYSLVCASPPLLLATASDGTVVVAEDELLCLPAPEACELSIFREADGRWVVESETSKRTLDQQELVIAGGLPWRVTLPASIVQTREVQLEREMDVQDIALDFALSRDGEHVSGKLVTRATSFELEFRAHLILLVVLARARLGDAAQRHLPASEHGWVYRDELLRELDVDLQLLNLWIFRARQQLARTGLRGAGQLIERRAGTHQLRIGVARLSVHEA